MASRKSQQNSATSVLDGYEPLEVIGSGTFGLIRKVRRISDGKVFARKELQFDRMTDRDRKQIVAEVNILRGLQHDNIVKYEERFIDRENQILYIVMEYCEGGDLGSTIKKCRKTNTLLPEDMVWSYLSQMVLGLDACHYRGSTSSSSSSGSNSPLTDETAIPATAVLHRDLKPENVFLDGSQNIKIGDFGLSKEVAAQSFACTYVGTPYYMSPELATGAPYDIKADIWALGCVAFELCSLAPPFDAQDHAELTRKIKLGHIPELPRGYSTELGNLIRTMLDLNPKRRPTTRHLLKEQPIRLACRTIELSVMSRKILAERNKLRAQHFELEMRERAIAAREEEVRSVQSSTSRERQLDEREANLQRRESLATEKERELAERERQVTEVAHRLQQSRGRHAEEVQPNRERSSSGQHTASSAVRRPMTRRISSGTVARIKSSPSAEFPIEIVHVRPAIVTPRMHKAEAVRQRFGKAGGLPALGAARVGSDRPSRHRMDSNGSEEWEDNETEVDLDRGAGGGGGGAAAVPSQDEASNKASSGRKSRQSCPSATMPAPTGAAAVPPLPTPSHMQTAEEALERYTSRPRSTRKSISFMSPNGRSWIHEEDISMRDASAFVSSDDKENQTRAELAWEKHQSLPAVEGKERPALMARATIATEAPFDSAPPPVYDLSNDEDLPSPFLRKVTRQSNEALAKRVAKSGSGLVGPNNFLARAAAAGAARQSMAAVATTTATSSSAPTVRDAEVAAGPQVPANRKSVTSRRMSAIPASTSSRTMTLTVSNSALDMRAAAGESAAPVIKRRSSAVPTGTTRPFSAIPSSRKSGLPAPPVPAIRQRAN